MPTPVARTDARGCAPAYPHFSEAVRSLLALNAMQCRWPLKGGGSDGSFCAAPRAGRSSYCGRHEAMAREDAR